MNRYLSSLQTDFCFPATTTNVPNWDILTEGFPPATWGVADQFMDSQTQTETILKVSNSSTEQPFMPSLHKSAYGSILSHVSVVYTSTVSQTNPNEAYGQC